MIGARLFILSDMHTLGLSLPRKRDVVCGRSPSHQTDSATGRSRSTPTLFRTGSWRAILQGTEGGPSCLRSEESGYASRAAGGIRRNLGLLAPWRQGLIFRYVIFSDLGHNCRVPDKEASPQHRASFPSTRECSVQRNCREHECVTVLCGDARTIDLTTLTIGCRIHK
jgi:hypothetical protein